MAKQNNFKRYLHFFQSFAVHNFTGKPVTETSELLDLLRVTEKNLKLIVQAKHFHDSRNYS